MSEMPPSAPPGGSSAQPPTARPPTSSDRQMMLALSYIALLGLIPLFAKAEDREIRWHAKNGLGLFGVYFLTAVFIAIVDFYVGIPCAGALVHCPLFIAYVALVVFAIMKALRGERLRLPVISDMADK